VGCSYAGVIEKRERRVEEANWWEGESRKNSQGKERAEGRRVKGRRARREELRKGETMGKESKEK
jgi:hypothetical protein